MRHRPGYSLGKNIKLHEMKNEKNCVGFLITKIWQILKRFSIALSYVNINQEPGHSLGKNIKLHKMKNEKTTWVFLLQKYCKF